MIEIINVKVYGLDEAVNVIGFSYNKDGADFNLAKKLASAKPCSGHDCFLKGITVNFTLNAPHYFIIEMQRYHFLDIVMSTSKMHSLKDIDFFMDNLPEEIDVNVKRELMLLHNKWLDTENEQDWRNLLANLPLGFMLKMRMVTNYLQLKNIYWQRCKIKHKLSEWEAFGDWIKSLPLLGEVV